VDAVTATGPAAGRVDGTPDRSAFVPVRADGPVERLSTAARTAPSSRWVGVTAVVGALSAAWCLADVWGRTWHQYQLDLAVYVLGSRHLVDGHLYSVSLPGTPHLPFTYPPIAALAFVPLSALSRQTGQLVWAAVNVVCLCAVLVLSLRAVVPGIHRTRLALVALCAMGPVMLVEPVWLTFYFGQVNLVLCAAILVDLTLVVRLGDRTLPRGVLLGICAAVKLIPLVFVPYLFVTRQFRAAWTSLVAFAGATLVALLVNPSVTWSYFTKYATDAQRVGGVFFISNQSLRGAVDRLAHHVVPVPLVTVAEAAVLVAGIALARWAYLESSSFLGILVCATTGMLVSPISWEHHLVWAVPIMAWLALAPDRPTGGPVWAALAAGILVWAPLLRVPSGGDNELHEHGWQLVIGQSFFGLMALFLVGVAVQLAVRRRRAGPGVSGRPHPAATAAAAT
jgi:alpha-1,2-mannosyltransferase